MGAFWKAAAAILIAAIFSLALSKQEKDLSTLLTLAVCCMAGAVLLSYLEPVLDLMWELESLGRLQGGMLSVLLKAVGITLIAELAGMICTDSGNGSLAKCLQFLGSAVILYLSIPVFQAFLTLIREILGEL